MSVPHIPAPIKNPEIKYTKLFINNEWLNSETGKTFPVTNPTTGTVITQVHEGDKTDIHKAVAAARKAFELGTEWRTMDASKRGLLLHKLADLMERDMIYIASLESLNVGKPYTHALDDVKGAIKMARYYSGWADKVTGQTIPVDGDFFTYTRREAMGVVGEIIPSNFPFMMAVQKLTPAVATGNCVILKPAEQTPLTALYLAALTKEVGFPTGVVHVVPGYGPKAGDALCEHMDVDKVGFTGSTELGKIITATAARSNLKKVTMELGGKSPNIVFDDCDLDHAVDMTHLGVFHNMGQIHCASTRTYVQDTIYDEFVKRSVEKAKKRVIGDPFDMKTESGPLVDKNSIEKVLDMIEIGKKEGAKLECGGKRWGSKGYFVESTIFTDVKDHMRIAKEEIFGPVMLIFKFSDIKDVIKRANDTTYGLSASVFTRDINKAITVANTVRAGTVWINNLFGGGCQTPFGGYKMSGNGRENGSYGLDEFTEVKTVTIKIPKKSS